MILFSIAAAGCSLLPIAVHGFGFSAEIAWASSSVLALLLHVGSAVYMVRTTRRLYADVRADKGRPYVMVLAFSSVVAAILFLALNVLEGRSFGPYFLSLCVFLGLAAHLFYRTLSVLRSSRPAV